MLTVFFLPLVLRKTFVTPFGNLDYSQREEINLKYQSHCDLTIHEVFSFIHLLDVFAAQLWAAYKIENDKSIKNISKNKKNRITLKVTLQLKDVCLTIL